MTNPRLLWPLVAVLLIVALAAGLRFWRLGELPPGLYHDEAYYGLDALALRRGQTFPRFYEGWELCAAAAHADRPATPTRFPVFFEGNCGREPLHVYLISLTLRLFGNTPLAVRAVSAAAGTLAVLTTWLAARALFPPRPGRLLGGELLPLLAAFALAVIFPALHFSRFGIRAMTLLPLATLSVYAFWRGWSGRRAGWLATAGFFVGLSLYTFAAARLLPFVFILFGGYLLLTDRPSLRAQWRGLASATVIALLTAAPLLLYFLRYPYFFAFRMAYVANRGAGVVEGAPVLTWLLNVGRVVGGLFWRGETHLRHNLPGRPYLDPAHAGLFLVGAWRAVGRRRQPNYAFALIWFGVMLVPSILSGDAPHFGRLIGAAPPAAILIAVGGTWLAEAVARRAAPRAAVALVVALCILSLGLTVRDYFGRYAAHPDLARDFYRADWELGRYAAAQPADAVLYLSPSQEEMATIYFALGDPDRLRSFNGGDGLLAAGIPGRPAVYLVRPTDTTTLANLRATFPEGQTGTPGEAFIPFHLPANVTRVPVASLATADFGETIRLLGYDVVNEGDHLLVTLVWQAVVVPTLDFTAFVHLLAADGALAAQTDRPPTGFPTSDWRAGEIVIEHFRLELPPDLPSGDYRLQTGFYDPATVVRLGAAADLGLAPLP